MRKAAAFYDVDGTIYKGKTLVDFMVFYYKHLNRIPDLERERSRLELLASKGTSREQLNLEYYKQFKGEEYSLLVELGRAWFKQHRGERLFNSDVLASIEYHKARDHLVCLVSGSFWPCLASMADAIQVEHVLCTELECKEGVLTGEILTQTIGAGKARAVKGYSEDCAVSLTASYAYGDDVSDLELLELVGFPTIVSSQDNASFAEVGKARGWPVIGGNSL